MRLQVIGTTDAKSVFDELNDIINTHKISLTLEWRHVEKLSEKQLSALADVSLSLAIIKKQPTLLAKADGELMKLSLNWQAWAKRIVKAGRKSELLLQSCKPSSGMSVIDATAGLGLDTLLMASSGANVLAIEQNPIIAMLLMYEHQTLSTHQNWHKLLARVHIHHADSMTYLQQYPHKVDLVYLDPMFPNDSYQSKVGKSMQVLHQLALPPSTQDEQNLLQSAQSVLATDGKVVIKRPLSATHLANAKPSISFSNDAIRFDRYDNLGELTDLSGGMNLADHLQKAPNKGADS